MNEETAKALYNLARVSEVQLEVDEEGTWLCKLQDVMVHKEGAIVTARLWGQTPDDAIRILFGYVSDERIALYDINGNSFYRYNGTEFAKITMEEALWGGKK